MKKKFITILLILIYILLPSAVNADLIKGGVQESVDYYLPKEIYTGEFKSIEKNDLIEMTVEQVIDGTLSMEGDEFFAKITGDVGKNGVILPKGTVAHGIITQTKEAKRLGRDGYVSLKFDYLVTPDGRHIPIEGNMSSKMHPIKQFGKIVATDVGYTAVGGVAGGWLALNTFGIEAAIASQGYTVAGGAAIGGTVGLIMSLYRKGKNALISPGDQIKIRLKEPVMLPVYRDEALVQEELEYPGFTIYITDISNKKDTFGTGKLLGITVRIENLSDKTFAGMDITLTNDCKQVFYPSLFEDTSLFFTQIKPGDRIIGKIYFSVNDLKGTYWLTFKDRYTKKELAKVSLDNSNKKNISKKNKTKSKSTANVTSIYSTD